MFDWKKFNYWALEHYVIKVVEGDCDSCMKLFRQETQAYPSLQFGTHISSKTIDGNKCKFVIKRFKTEEVCRIHCTYPPSYIRTGKTL